MALKGSAFLALWNDFDPGRDDEYNCWHSFEHVPERVGIEGILSGRRYIARERRERRYFTLYELETLQALAGPQYADVVERPTEWSAAMRPSFRNFLRLPCGTLLTLGPGMTGSLATFRFGCESDLPAQAAASVLQPFLESAGIASIHLGAADETAPFPLKNVSRNDVPAPAKQYVLLVEALDRDALRDVVPAMGEALHERFSATAIARETYDLAFAIERSDLQRPTSSRQPPRPELQRRWR